MRGVEVRSGSLFSYVDLEARGAAGHPLRAIRVIVDEALARLDGDFEAIYAPIGRPSIPPEQLLRALFLQAFYTVRSERQLMEQLDYNLPFRWFAGLDADGAVIQRVKFRRDTLLAFFEQASKAMVGMEACSGAQRLARRLEVMGHRVRIVPAQFVEPYVKSQKNDTIDAEAITEAVTRPTMRFTRVRTTDVVDLQALHRIRDQLISSRTRLINQVRGFCLEYGVAIRQSAGVFRRELPRVLADEENDLTPTMRRMLAELYEDIERLDSRIAATTREVEALAARDDRARRLRRSQGSPRSQQRRSLPRSVTARSSGERAISQPGWVWFRDKPRPAAAPCCWGSPSAETATSAGYSSTAPARA